MRHALLSYMCSEGGLEVIENEAVPATLPLVTASLIPGHVLAWGSARLAAQGFTALLLIWDNASWHRSHAVRHWRRQHNRQVKQGAVGVRVVVCQLPSQSPWLNPIEPKWVHGKCAVSEADRLLSADELAMRVYAY